MESRARVLLTVGVADFVMALRTLREACKNLKRKDQ